VGPLTVCVPAGETFSEVSHAQSFSNAATLLLGSDVNLVDKVGFGIGGTRVKLKGSHGPQSFSDFCQVGQGSSSGGAASSISRASLGCGAGNWRGSSHGWCSPKPSGAMRHVTEMSKAITINNSSKRMDVAISHSNSSSVVRQCDLAAPFDGLGQGRVRGHHHERRKDMLQILVGMDG